MSRVIKLFIGVVLIILFQLIMYCADPLESLAPNNSPPVVHGGGIDTLLIIDTLNVSDTLTIIDTVYIVDTVNNFVCARIRSNQPDIIWMFRNDEGRYRLEFTATTEKDKPIQTLLVTIDGRKYCWKPSENPEFIKELELGSNFKVKISPTKPRCLGHTIHVCLTVNAK